MESYDFAELRPRMVDAFSSLNLHQRAHDYYCAIELLQEDCDEEKLLKSPHYKKMCKILS